MQKGLSASAGVNSFFRDAPWHQGEKREYVGEEQVRLVRELAVAGRDQLPWHLVTRR